MCIKIMCNKIMCMKIIKFNFDLIIHINYITQFLVKQLNTLWPRCRAEAKIAFIVDLTLATTFFWYKLLLDNYDGTSRTGLNLHHSCIVTLRSTVARFSKAQNPTNIAEGISEIIETSIWNFLFGGCTSELYQDDTYTFW